MRGFIGRLIGQKGCPIQQGDMMVKNEMITPDPGWWQCTGKRNIGKISLGGEIGKMPLPTRFEDYTRNVVSNFISNFILNILVNLDYPKYQKFPTFQKLRQED